MVITYSHSLGSPFLLPPPFSLPEMGDGYQPAAVDGYLCSRALLLCGDQHLEALISLELLEAITTLSREGQSPSCFFLWSQF